MFLVHLWNYIRGYVIIIAKGRFIERFINICTRRQILLWDISRRDSESVIMKASLGGFLLMRPAARKSHCRIHIMKKCGLPFFFGRFKRRKGFKAGLLFFAALMVLFTSMIWDVEIKGCGKETTDRIMTVLEAGHIRPGTFKIGLDPKGIARSILLDVDGVAWAGVEIKGVKLTVSIESAVPKPVVIKENETFNIIAERDGLVTGLEIFMGSPKVKEGETVKKGQLLVSGKLEPKNLETGVKETKDVHALGRVLARTWYDIRTPVPMEYVKRIRTGKTHENTYVRILDFKFKLPGGRALYKTFESVTFDKTLAGPFNSRLPVGVTVETIYEVKEEIIQLSREDAEAIALEKARKTLLEKLPEDCRMIGEKVNYLKGETGGETLELIYECEEDIARLEPMGGD